MQPEPTGARRRVGRARRGTLAAILTLGLVVPVGAAPAAADEPTTDPIPAAAGWVARDLGARANPTGDVLADAVLAFAASGSAGDLAATTFASLAEVAEDHVGDDVNTAGDAAKIILAAAAMGADPTDLDGFDAEAALRGTLDANGRFSSIGGTQLFVQSLAILALSTTEDGVPVEAVDFLLDEVCDDGGFNALGNCGFGSDVDTTAVATQALLATDRPVDGQVAYLLGQRNAAGALPVSDPDANASALAAQALRAAGETAAADAAANFVTSLQKGCDAPVGRQGAIATYPDADGNLRLATTQGVFARADRLDQLDIAGAAAATSFLDCGPGEPCSTTAGVTVVVDFTALAPGLDAQVACVEGPIAAGTSGHDLLEAAGFTTNYASFAFGDSICQIDDLPHIPPGGDPTSTCFEQGYWSYWTAEPGGEWDDYQVGGGDSRPTAGTIEGWSWAPAFAAAPPRFDTSLDLTDPTDPTDPTLPTPPYDRGIEAACPGEYTTTFRDIAGSVHARAIRCLATAAITLGTSDPTRYDPRGEVTRAQIASFLARSYEEATGDRLPAGRDRFRDDDGSVHERNINALAAAGVIQGVGDGTRFAPNDTVTRAQMAAFLDRFLDLLDDGRVNRSFPPATTANVFRDDDGSVHAGSIDRLAVQGVVRGRPDGSYGPNGLVTRDQLASFLARAIDLAVSEDLADPVG